MAANRATFVSMRCPVCFGREIDVLLLHDGSVYYCVKCSFRGTVQEIRDHYAALKRKYSNRRQRLTIEQIDRL